VAFSGRHISFEACFNFRDIGGYETIDGRRVRWGAVFRADGLHRLTSTDVDAAMGLGLRTVIDLRSTAELDRNGRFARADDVTFHHMPLFEEETLPFKFAEPGDPEPAPGEEYVAMATSGATLVAGALRVVAEGDHAVVFHCAAGKDRTGIVAALILSSLGVPDESIVADYHLSEMSLEPWLAWAEANAPEAAAQAAMLPRWVLRAPVPNMQAFLDILRERHGSIQGYLTEAGVEDGVLAALRARLLES
jgi:protein tyrosine/serine phosphatase